MRDTKNKMQNQTKEDRDSFSSYLLDLKACGGTRHKACKRMIYGAWSNIILLPLHKIFYALPHPMNNTILEHDIRIVPNMKLYLKSVMHLKLWLVQISCCLQISWSCITQLLLSLYNGICNFWLTCDSLALGWDYLVLILKEGVLFKNCLCIKKTIYIKSFMTSYMRTREWAKIKMRDKYKTPRVPCRWEAYFSSLSQIDLHNMISFTIAKP